MEDEPRYDAIIELAGLVLLDRDFVEHLDEVGLDAVLEERFPDGNDLTEDQRATFLAASHDPDLRAIIARWWVVYDQKRASGVIPEVDAAWQP